MEKQNNEIEWNSMAAVLKRLDRITWDINFSRSNNDIKGMVNLLIQYYKEISADLKPEEQEIWKELNKLKRLTAPILDENQGYLLNQLDEVDLKLRAMAKRHGYLTKTKDSGSGAMID